MKGGEDCTIYALDWNRTTGRSCRSGWLIEYLQRQSRGYTVMSFIGSDIIDSIFVVKTDFEVL